MGNNPEAAKAVIVVGGGCYGRDTAKILTDTLDKPQYHQKLEETSRKIEAAKQRELELLAVIDKMRDVLYMVDEEYCYTNDHRVSEAMALSTTTPQALREHEAKVLEEAADVAKDLSERTEVFECAEIERRILRMAEERRRNEPA